MERIKLTNELKIRVPSDMFEGLVKVARRKFSTPSQVGREAINEFLLRQGALMESDITPLDPPQLSRCMETSN